MTHEIFCIRCKSGLEIIKISIGAGFLQICYKCQSLQDKSVNRKTIDIK